MRAFIRNLFKASSQAETIHAEISAELEFHLQNKIADLVRDGMDPVEASRLAHQKFGAVQRIGEQGFDVRGHNPLGDWIREFGHALRLLRQHPLKSTVLIVTLALGVGANTAAFGVIKSVLVEPLPFASPEQLVVLRQSNHGQLTGVSYPHLQDWRARTHVFSGMAAYLLTTGTLTGFGDPAHLNGAIVSASLLRVLGVQPLRGNLFADADDRFNHLNKIVITDRLWRVRFGGRNDIVGQIIQLDDRPFFIAGVIPAGSAFPLAADPPEFWITVASDANPALYHGTIPRSRGYARYQGALARLHPGVSLATAAAEMTAVAHEIERQHPNTTDANQVAVIPAIYEVVGGSSRTLLLLLYGAVFCVLLVACVNVANVVSAEAVLRHREFALRLALGARISRLVRQLLVESIALALAASVASLAVGFSLTRLFVALAPTTVPRVADVHLGLISIFYVLLLSLAAGAIAGCLPALMVSRLNLNGLLKEGALGVSRRASGPRLANILVVLQIALSMMLTCSAALLATSFHRIVSTPRGFNPHGVLTASIDLPVARYGQQNARVLTFYRRLVTKLRAMPGVRSAALSDVLPLSGESNTTTVEIAGTRSAGLPETALRFVDPSFFSTLRIPLKTGRLFTDRDTANGSHDLVVNEAFVRRYLDGKDPLTQSVRLGWGGDETKQIIAVVGDIHPNAVLPSSVPEVYVPFAQFPLNDMCLLISATGSPDQIAPSLQRVVSSIDPLIPVDRIRTLDQYLLLTSSSQQFLMWLVIGFAAVTALLMSVGIYGVLSNATNSRRQEFGIRMAIGGSRRHISALVFSQALTLTVMGLAAGVLLSRYSSHLLAAWLFDTGSDNQTAIVGLSGGVLLITVLAACAIPVRRAVAVDPASVLRAS